MRHVLLSVILVAILIAGCDAAEEEDADATTTSEPTEVVAEQESEDPTATEEEATEAADESEATAADTATSEPTATETPTPEPTATSTATPTPQPTATATPEPTATPAPTATPVPEPITYTGTGTNVIDIDKPGGPDSAALVYVSGNAADRHFAITSHDASGEQVDLLVNTTDPYEGVVPLDFFDDERTTRFQVDAEGSWHIEIRPLSSARATAAPGSISGVGDDVFVVDGTPDVAHVVGNAEGSHFAVIGYGGGYDLLVNTTDPYDGRVIVSSGSIVFEVTGAGNWEIIFE